MIIILGYGFLGSAIYDALKLRGSKVCVISKSFPVTNNVDFIQSTLDEIPSLISTIKNIETIIHCIHTTVPKTSMDDNLFDLTSNVIPFIKLINICKSSSVKNFIYLSSGGAVYGRPYSTLPVNETHSTNPISSYGVTKLMCEKYLLINKFIFAGNCVILRPSNIYGKGQKINKPHGIIGHIINALLNGSTLSIWGDGNGVKDYLDIDSFTDAVMKVLFMNKKLDLNVYNLSSGNTYSVNFLVNVFEKKFKRNISVMYNDEKEFDVNNISLDNKLFSETFHWHNNKDIDDFIKTL